MKRKRLIRIALIALAVPVLGLAIAWFSYSFVAGSSSEYCSDQIDNLPKQQVAIVLGTSPSTVQGSVNYYFANRIAAASELYHSGTVKYLLVSGDNRTEYYNEPEQMRKALIDAGVPSENIVLDYAGLRTLDSMIRLKEVFGQDSAIVVSQAFHNERAVYIGRTNDMYVWGYNASDIHTPSKRYMKFREMLARTLMLVDVHITHRGPRHLGPREYIPARN